jgi:hypothetical protein
MYANPQRQRPPAARREGATLLPDGIAPASVRCTARVVKLEHARTMKLMGAPPNTPVNTRPFSEQYTTHWAAMMNAHADFMATLTRFVEDGGQSADKWWSVRRRHVAHYTAVIRVVDELAGKWDPTPGGCSSPNRMNMSACCSRGSSASAHCRSSTSGLMSSTRSTTVRR